MKPTAENIKTLVNGAYYEGKRAEMRGQSITLPDDIPAFFDAVEERATGLPDGFSDFEYGLKRYTGWARHAYETGDDARLRKYIWIIYQNLNNLSHDLEIHNREEGNSKGGKSGTKYSQWAEILAAYLVEAYPGQKFDAAWAAIPEATDAPLVIESDAFDLAVYRDGNKVVAMDHETTAEMGDKTKSTFEKSYYRPARNAGR